MTKEKFIETINYIHTLYIESEKFNDMMREIDSEFGGGFIHNKTINFLENLLIELMNDKCNEISYFLWELDFGSKYEDGCITGPNGEIIKLATPEDLYNLILEDNK